MTKHQASHDPNLKRVERLMQEKGIIGTVESRPGTYSPLFENHTCWTVTFEKKETGYRITWVFFTPYAWGMTPPTPAFVLNTWLADISHIVDGSSYEQWCDKYIFDPLDEDAQDLYQRSEKTADLLTDFLGENLHLFLYGG